MGYPLPDISYDTFKRTKWWQKVVQLQGRAILDSDFNEAQDIARYRDWLNLTTAVALDTRIGDGFRVTEAAVPINNVNLTGGLAISFGAVVLAEGDTVLSSGVRVFTYEPTNPTYFNRVCEGTVTFVDAPNHRVMDENKSWLPDHRLSGCRLAMTSGPERGNVFTIKNDYGTGWTENSLVLEQLGSFGVQAGDTYVVLPPKLTTPSLGSSDRVRTDLVYLQTWYEHINSDEDPTMISPLLPDAQSNRVQLRWCVRVAEGYYDPATARMISGELPTASDSDDPFGVHYTPLATISRPSGEPRIFTSQISNYRGVEVPLPALSQEVVDGRTSGWFGDFSSLELRLEQMENTVRDSKLFNGSFELGEAVGSNIPGWIPSSTSWLVTTTAAQHQSRCVRVDHESRHTTRTETLVSLPFYVRPNQKIRFSGAAKCGQSGATVTAILELFDNFATWNGIPALSKVLTFGSGTGDWTPLEDTFYLGARNQWGRVRLVVERLENGSVYFDDLRVEYLEEAMNNTRGQFPAVEVFSGRFGEGFRGWNVNQQYAQTSNVQVIEATGEWPTLKLSPSGSITAPEIGSWPVNVGAINTLDDVLVLSFEGRYSGLNYGVLAAGPYVYLKFYDSGFNEVTTANEPLYLNVQDWGTAATETQNPAASPAFNMYTGLFSVPANAAMFTVHLGLSSTAGSAEFRNLQVLRFGSSVQMDVNQSYHDLCANGEFGRGLLDSDLTDVQKLDPDLGKFEVMNWQLSGESSQIIHWVKNTPTISSPSGDRVVEFRVDGATAIPLPGVAMLQTATRTMTQQDFLHGFVLDFQYSYGSVPINATFSVEVEFLDSTGVAVGSVTSIDLLDPAAATKDWTRKVVGVAPPSPQTVTVGGGSVFSAPVYLRFGFRMSLPSAAGSAFYARVAGVKLWSRTIPTSNNPLTDTQYKALKGYWTHDSVGHEKLDTFYTTGWQEPADDNRYLLEKDRDLMRYTRPHAQRHYPGADGVPDEYLPEGQADDVIPNATAGQTGLLSSADWEKFNDAIQKEDLAGLFHYGVHEGLYVDEYGKVWPGYAIDYNNRRLELAAPVQLTIPSDPLGATNENRADVVYIIYDSVTSQPAVRILSGQAVGSNYLLPDMTVFNEGGALQDAIILAVCQWDQQQYEDEYVPLSDGDKLLYRKHWHGTGTRTPPVPPSVQQTWKDYDVWQTPIEYLFNAANVGSGNAPGDEPQTIVLSPPPGGHVVAYPYIPTYNILDSRFSAYRIIRLRDDDLVMFYTINPNDYAAEEEGVSYRSVAFAEFGNSPHADIGWGDGYPLTGAFTHWEDFLTTYRLVINRMKGFSDGTAETTWDDSVPSMKDIKGTTNAGDAVPVTLLTLKNLLNTSSGSTATYGITNDNVKNTAYIEQKKLDWFAQSSAFVFGYWESMCRFFIWMGSSPEDEYDFGADFHGTVHPSPGVTLGQCPAHFKPIGLHQTGDNDVATFVTPEDVGSGGETVATLTSKFASTSTSNLSYGPAPLHAHSDLSTVGPFSEDSASFGVQSVLLPPGTDRFQVKLRFAATAEDLVLSGTGSPPPYLQFFLIMSLLNPRVMRTPSHWRTFMPETGEDTDDGAGVIAYSTPLMCNMELDQGGDSRWDGKAYVDYWLAINGLSSLTPRPNSGPCTPPYAPYQWALPDDYETVLVRFDVAYRLRHATFGDQVGSSLCQARVMGSRGRLRDVKTSGAEDYEVFPVLPCPIMYSCSRQAHNIWA